MLLMRVLLPNRPGALGAVATALGSIGADINLVEIVEKRQEIEVEEFILELPPGQGVESIVAACDALEGVQVKWIRNYPRGGGIEHDLQVRHRMAADPGQAAETLVAAAPVVFRAEWGLLLDVAATPTVTYSTLHAPPFPPATLHRFAPFDQVHRVLLDDGQPAGPGPSSAIVAPLPPQRTVVVGRLANPPFLDSELARLGYLAGVPSDDSAGSHQNPSPASGPQGEHRRPLAEPLYRNDD